MPRQSRQVIPGWPHHITQRGNNRQQVFFDEEDYLAFLFMMRRHAVALKMLIHGYCLMPNHFHVGTTPPDEHALSLFAGRLQQDYTLRMKGRRAISGHLWQARFHSSPLDDAYLINTMRYMEQNPERARLVLRSWEYRWSSAQAHITGHDPYRILDLDGWLACYTPDVWREILSQPEDLQILDYIRRQTFAGQLMQVKK
jgi:putative transposase